MSQIIGRFFREHLYNIRNKPEQWWEAFCMWVAWHLSHDIVMWCFIRVFAHGTTGDYGSTDVTSVTASGIMKRWHEDFLKSEPVEMFLVQKASKDLENK